MKLMQHRLFLIIALLVFMSSLGMMYIIIRYFGISFTNQLIGLRSISLISLVLILLIVTLVSIKNALGHLPFRKLFHLSGFSMHAIIILFVANVGIYYALRYLIKAQSNNCFTRDEVNKGCSQSTPHCYYIYDKKVYEITSVPNKYSCTNPHNCTTGKESECHTCGSDVTAKMPANHVTAPLMDLYYLGVNLKGYLRGETAECPQLTPSPTPVPTPTYAYPTPSYAYPTPAEVYATPYSYPTPAYNYPTPPQIPPTPPTGGTKINRKPTPAPTVSSFSTESRVTASILDQTPTPDTGVSTSFSGLIVDTVPGNSQGSNPTDKVIPPAASLSPVPSASPLVNLNFTAITVKWSRILAYAGFASLVLTLIIWIGLFGIRNLRK